MSRRRDGGRVGVPRHPAGRALAVILSLVATVPLAGQERGPFLGQAALLYRGVTLIDGRGGPARPNSSVLVWDGRIQAVGSPDQMLIPEGTRVVDLSGRFMIPGLIDVHAVPGDSATLARLLGAGVTSVRSSGLDRATWEARRAGWDPDGPLPTVYSSGPLLDAPGEGARGLLLRSPEEAREAVGRIARESPQTFSLSPRLPPALVEATLDAAEGAEIPAWGELRDTDWVTAVRHGIDALAHLLSGASALLPAEAREAYERSRRASPDESLVSWLEALEVEGEEVDRLVGALLSRDVTVVPMLAAAEGRLVCPEPRPDEACGRWSDSTRQRALRALPKLVELTRLLHRDGVRLVAGSDAPRSIPPGIGLHRELELLVSAGISPLEVVSIATRNAAVALGVLHDRGTIEAGKRADLVVLTEDPSEAIRNARRIDFIVLDGRAYRAAEDGGFERLEFR